jgi:hypothetical protein
MSKETEQFLARRAAWLNRAADAIQTNSPLLSRSEAIEVAKIALKSWQDLRPCIEWQETADFIQTL